MILVSKSQDYSVLFACFQCFIILVYFTVHIYFVQALEIPPSELIFHFKVVKTFIKMYLSVLLYFILIFH